MSEALDKARQDWIDAVCSGKQRNFDEPIKDLRGPEPSNHPDARMRMALKEVEAFYNPPQDRSKYRKIVLVESKF